MSIDISEADLWIEYPEWSKPERYAMVQDELELVVQRPNGWSSRNPGRASGSSDSTRSSSRMDVPG
jgi:hypothetical protein